MDRWWIDEPRLLGCGNPKTPELEALGLEGFTVIVSLLQEEEQPPGYGLARAQDLGFARHNIAVKDFSPPTASQLAQFVELIERLPKGAKVVVHCQGGSGRTGTFAAAYWITKGMVVSSAISHVREARQHAIETAEQEAVLADFALKWNNTQAR